VVRRRFGYGSLGRMLCLERDERPVRYQLAAATIRLIVAER
jgi:hypothetical protein